MWGAPTILRVAVPMFSSPFVTNLHDRLASCSTNVPALLTFRSPALHDTVIACPVTPNRVGGRRHLTKRPNQIKIENLQKSGETSLTSTEKVPHGDTRPALNASGIALKAESRPMETIDPTDQPIA